MNRINYITDVTPEDFKAEREKMRLSQIDLAERLGVTATTIYRWENGLAPISKTVVLAMRQIKAELRKELEEDQ